jgi:hypothetical protein
LPVHPTHHAIGSGRRRERILPARGRE